MAVSALSFPFVVLDTETTGFVPRTHRVIEYACMVSQNGAITSAFEQLFSGSDLPPMIQVLTRIRPDDVVQAPTFAQCLEQIRNLIPAGAVIVGQNVQFDIGMLKGEGLDLSHHPYLDTAMLASLVYPELESYSLPYLSATLGLNHTPAHRAMGDVRATYELLQKTVARLQAMTGADRTVLLEQLAKGPEGWRILGHALSAAEPQGPAFSVRSLSQSGTGTVDRGATQITAAKDRTVTILDEPFDERLLPRLLRGAMAESSFTTCVAVKNLRIALEQLPDDLLTTIADGRIQVIYPPHALLDHAALETLTAQPAYTSDETTVALKCLWTGARNRYDLALHGTEESVWNGKLRSTALGHAYIQQFATSAHVCLLEHRELLHILDTPDHPGHRLLGATTHVIIDDASMLEDTTTRAFGWFCSTDDLRAASTTEPLLGKFVDTLQLWIEQVRSGQDVRYITGQDLIRPETKGLREQLSSLRELPLPEQTQRALEHLSHLLTPERLADRVCYIEVTRNGNQILQSVPLRIGELLWKTLFTTCRTTLLIPAHSHTMLPEILPGTLAAGLGALQGDAKDLQTHLPIATPTDTSLEQLLTNPPAGKTIILLPGRQTIENMYVKYTESLERQNVTLICQGLSGGLGRMQAEFRAATGTAVWLLTPWMFEGVDMPSGSVDRLYINTLPFDYPSHPIYSQRSQCYGDAFTDYSLPRLLHRLFRLLRVFARVRTASGQVNVVDDRLFSKKYGERVRAYLAAMSSIHARASAATAAKPRPAKRKPDGPQQSLF